jgi:hypothetical protein
VLPFLLNRISLGGALLGASTLMHLLFLGALVLAERRAAVAPRIPHIDVELVRPEELQKPPQPEPPKPEQPQQKPAKPEPLKPQELSKVLPESQAPSSPPAPAAKAADPAAAPEKPEKQEKQEKVEKQDKPGVSGGAPGEGKSKLTPEEIAALRAQVQKCWKLPVGIPGMLGLDVVIRTSFGPRGQIVGEPVLLKAPASERGPMLVGIAMTALKDCSPYRMPAAKYADWKVLDLRFLATGMTGLGSVPQPPQAKRH